MILQSPLPVAWPARTKRDVLNWMVPTLECGPMDGGCVLVARALQQRFGGEVMCMIRSTDDTADHAVVALPGGWLMDMDGLHASASHALAWFNHQEMTHVTHLRPWQSHDLENAQALATPQHIETLLSRLPKSLPRSWQRIMTEHQRLDPGPPPPALDRSLGQDLDTLFDVDPTLKKFHRS